MTPAMPAATGRISAQWPTQTDSASVAATTIAHLRIFRHTGVSTSKTANADCPITDRARRTASSKPMLPMGILLPSGRPRPSSERPSLEHSSCYLEDLLEDLLEVLLAVLLDDRLDGTLPPARLASDRPMAIACLRLVTLFPERPLLSVPRFRSCIALSTFLCAVLPYLAIILLLDVVRYLAGPALLIAGCVLHMEGC